jgi:hypothetical protein
MHGKISQARHIEQNREAFDQALAAATRSVREDRHFVGMNNIRQPIDLPSGLKSHRF